MEKNTKILLGLAAAGVLAYLVLKPKKVITNSYFPSKMQMESQTLQENYPENQEIQKLFKTDFCASDPNSYSCYVQKGGGFMPIKRTPDYIMTEKEMEACNKDPRNCKM
jgi:hypothetical protein